MKSCTLRFINQQKGSVTMVLEPWAEEVHLAQHDLLVIKLESQIEGEPEVVFEEGSVVVYGWWGCQLRFEINGVPQVELPNVPSRSQDL